MDCAMCVCVCVCGGGGGQAYGRGLDAKTGSCLLKITFCVICL